MVLRGRCVDWENKPLRSGTQLLTKSAPARFAMAEPGFFCIGYVPDPFSIGKSRKSLIADEATTPAPKLYLASWRDGCSVCIQTLGRDDRWASRWTRPQRERVALIRRTTSFTAIDAGDAALHLDFIIHQD